MKQKSTKRKKHETIAIPDKVVIETFRDMRGSYYIGDMTQKEPSSFNGRIEVRKYRITIELIDEPIEIIQARIQKLWDECENHHHWDPLKATAKKYGMELNHE